MNRQSMKIFDGTINRRTSRPSENVLVYRHANARMVQNVLLVWLDTDNNEMKNTDCRNAIAQLRSIVHSFKAFTDKRTCIEFIGNVKNEKVCMIISGSLDQNIVFSVHHMPHMHSIFIYCGNKNVHESWIQEYPKVKGVYTTISPIYGLLKSSVQECEQNSISINYMASSDITARRNLEKIDPSFLFPHVLKDIVLNINFDENHFQQLLDYARILFAQNKNELKNINMFESKYYYSTPIWWYTHDCFMYSMLNRGLRSFDMNILTKMSFFIGDLYHQIERLHEEQFRRSQAEKSFTVYHGQGLSKSVAEQMIKAKNGFISFNNFLCASTDRRIPFDFANRAANMSDCVGILFVLTIVPSKSTTPFAFINSIGQFEGKDEVLFPLHTIFRIREIQSIDENNHLLQVGLTLSSDTNDEDIFLTNRIRDASCSHLKGWYRLGQLLMKMQQFDKAEQIHDILLERASDENEKGSIYKRIGQMNEDQMAYRDALIYYEKAMKIFEKFVPVSHSDLATSYESIASIYEKKKEYAQAIDYHEKALEIRRKIFDPNHPELVASYQRISLTRSKLSENFKELPPDQLSINSTENSSSDNHLRLQRWKKNLDCLKNRVGFKFD